MPRVCMITEIWEEYWNCTKGLDDMHFPKVRV
jgi:hypothetical protein